MAWHVLNQTTGLAVSYYSGRVRWALGSSPSYIEIEVQPQHRTTDTAVSLGDVLLVYSTLPAGTAYLFRGKVEAIEDLGDDARVWRVRAHGLLMRL